MSSACLASCGTAADLFSESLSFTQSTFLRPLAPRALPRFLATMDALTSVPARLFGFLADVAPLNMNTVSGPKQTSLLHVTEPSRRSVSNHPSLPPATRPGFLHRDLPRELPRIPLRGLTASWASPFTRRLATATGRIEFVSLPTGSSPPVALHPALRRRSYLRLSRPGPAPSEDFHLTDSVRSQAHECGSLLPLWESGPPFNSASEQNAEGRRTD